ncbi:hypothetical protein ASPZODRAFT_131993 [Penicilliopsis zonata CBS 506.65]|uniref:Uncharacterized protein n=1 Tax=Penicilliopsis zonata CBS 506.65 TaxID=1073090 RepID=A0A1L9SIK9_9EURO|nr:hypothetical protein ASPZODRAFT_131993 [Penicilliopsis zonata CBS 506.65]OJJ47062.1 hypothetical protein ASPZODRAFT_131993 [Penicilliopsis zonata CBS 506.65]
MSYAEAAAKGPKQSPEDVRAPPPAKVQSEESGSTTSLIDVDQPHVASVDSSFLEQDVKTTTQAERLEREAAQEAERLEDKAKDKARKARARAKDDKDSFFRNSDNPVVIGNAVLLTLAGAGLGFGAYHKHTKGQLSWELVGLWSGVVGAVGVADYFVSKWFFQNKYPPK